MTRRGLSFEEYGHRWRAAEEHGNLDLWLTAQSPYRRWWLERYTMREIRSLGREIDRLDVPDHSKFARQRRIR